jgi:WD40 repeat protein
VAWSPTQALIATGGGEAVRLWRASHTAAEQELDVQGERTYVLGWSPTEHKLLTAGTTGLIRLWGGDPLACLAEWPAADADVNMPRGEASWSPDGSRVLSVGRGVATVWSGGFEPEALPTDARVNLAAWSPDGLRIATAELRGGVRIFSAAELSQVSELREVGAVEKLYWSADGKRLVTANPVTARIWDAKTGEALLEYTSDYGRVQDALESVDGDRVVVVPHSSVVLLLEGAQTTVLEGHAKLVHGAGWSRDGQRLATWSEDGTCRVWDPDSATSILELRHDAQVFAAAWSLTDDRIITTSGDGTARIWDAASGGELARLHHTQDSWIVRAAWSYDGRRVATNDHRQCLVWDATTDPRELIRTAGERAFRTLTAAERDRFGLTSR